LLVFDYFSSNYIVLKYRVFVKSLSTVNKYKLQCW